MSEKIKLARNIDCCFDSMFSNAIDEINVVVQGNLDIVSSWFSWLSVSQVMRNLLGWCDVIKTYPQTLNCILISCIFRLIIPIVSIFSRLNVLAQCFRERTNVTCCLRLHRCFVQNVSFENVNTDATNTFHWMYRRRHQIANTIKTHLNLSTTLPSRSWINCI